MHVLLLLLLQLIIIVVDDVVVVIVIVKCVNTKEHVLLSWTKVWLIWNLTIVGVILSKLLKCHSITVCGSKC